MFRRRLPHVHDGFGNFLREIQLSRAEAFRRILERHLRALEPVKAVFDHPRAVDGDGLDLVLRLAEDDAALRRRSRIIHVSRRLNVNSVLDADGKPTSISLKPILTSVWNNSNFWETFIGTASAWLPSRKSTLHQRGAAVSTRFGHWRSGKWMAGNARYFFVGSFCMVV